MFKNFKVVQSKDYVGGNLVWSRGLSWEEVDQLTEWFSDHKHLFRGKFLQNHKRAVREIKEYISMGCLGLLPPSNNVRLHVDSNISPELAVLFKLTWG